jgi:hypothetical protein
VNHDHASKTEETPMRDRSPSPGWRPLTGADVNLLLEALHRSRGGGAASPADHRALIDWAVRIRVAQRDLEKALLGELVADVRDGRVVLLKPTADGGLVEYGLRRAGCLSCSCSEDEEG